LAPIYLFNFFSAGRTRP